MYIFVPVELSVKILRTLYYPLTDLIGNELCYIITWTEIHATMYAQMHTFFVTCFRYVCLFHENIFFPLTPRSFGRIILVISFFVPLIITYGVVNATDHLVTLDACLGHYEQTYVKTSGNQLCNSGSYFDTGFCKVVFVLYAIISSHIPEAILLYRCFRMIQIQTELSHDLIGDKQYIQRRRYFNTKYFNLETSDCNFAQRQWNCHFRFRNAMVYGGLFPDHLPDFHVELSRMVARDRQVLWYFHSSFLRHCSTRFLLNR